MPPEAADADGFIPEVEVMAVPPLDNICGAPEEAEDATCCPVNIGKAEAEDPKTPSPDAPPMVKVLPSGCTMDTNDPGVPTPEKPGTGVEDYERVDSTTKHTHDASEETEKRSTHPQQEKKKTQL